MSEIKTIGFKVQDMNRGKREIVVAHAVYNNIDNEGDISRKGMFKKSWSESKAKIGFYLNHDEEKLIGKPIDFFEDDTAAYTRAKIGTHTLGNDTIEMIENDMITGASFKYITIQKGLTEVKGKFYRELKEVKHLETTLATYDLQPANDLAGIVSFQKLMEDGGMEELKANIDRMEKFCRNTTASDECIKNILDEIIKAKTILLRYNTADTSDGKPTVSVNNEESKAFSDSLYYLSLKTFN